MKKKNTIRMAMVLLALLAAGCHKPETHITVEPEQLLGKWQKDGSQEYWRYRSDSTGVTWDEAEDVSEEESNLTFEWTINGDRLTHVFRGAQGNQAVPKVYTVKEISESTMRWQDDYSMEYSFTKTE